jgi:cytochrome c2
MLGRSENIGKCVRRQILSRSPQRRCACRQVLLAGTGPSLFDVIGRGVASAANFDYAAALVRPPSRGCRVWTAPLNAHLSSPERVAFRTAMTFVGLPDPAERPDVIAARDGRAEE